ncbi:hypothetical protein HY483_00135 [Candidatus Woesearchaeota archaeon]|nr:hypothetical protein [Candidatus Woesearchaeota archaeon]
MAKSIEDVIGMNIILVPTNVGSPVLGDTLENLKSLLDRVVVLVGMERDLSRQGTKYDASSPFARGQNPYTPLLCSLRPKSWIGNGLTQEYYDQRIAIYNHVLELVEESRKNFCSSMQCDFTSHIQGYVRECRWRKEELKKSEEWSAWLKSQQSVVDKVFYGS